MRNELFQQLHDRATRGQALSEQEREQLDAWYAEMDRAEAADLGLTPVESTLPARVEQTLAEIAGAARRIRELEQRASEIEHENSILRARLGRRLSAQHA
ncbi:MAG: hypothetical protein AAF657_01325 [Acidobacteriota bacterium]